MIELHTDIPTADGTTNSFVVHPVWANTRTIAY